MFSQKQRRDTKVNLDDQHDFSEDVKMVSPKQRTDKNVYSDDQESVSDDAKRWSVQNKL